MTELPARPSLDDEHGLSKGVVLKISHDSNGASVATWGFFQLLKPILGAIWKADLRPHHALDFALGWRNRGTSAKGQQPVDAQLRVCRVNGEGWRVKLEVLPRGRTRRPVRERYVYQAGPVGPADVFYNEMQSELSHAAEQERGKLGAHAYAMPMLCPYCTHATHMPCTYWIACSACMLRAHCGQACNELGELLSEVRQMDLKLEEVRLTQRGGDTADIGGRQVHRYAPRPY